MEKPAEEVLAEITDHEFYQKRDPSGAAGGDSAAAAVFVAGEGSG